MSVLVAAEFQGGTARFRQPLLERAGEFRQIAAGDREAGPVHHQL